MDDIDNTIESVEEWEAKQRGEVLPARPAAGSKVLVGTVEQFFDKINVAAITLRLGLKVGDTIEIVSGDDAIRQKVSSMQINREDVIEAGEGDDVGIKVNHPVSVGSDVYKVR
ncbi:MAG: hypothetical protein KGH72_03085 [Candidatus Micrarchaeota archaeon]|nr:hypothetical protein [Candidatus Micrarchaeota archaeon]